MRPKRFWILWDVWRKPCTYLAVTLTISTNGQIPHDTRHLGVPLRASKTISEPMAHSVQTVHLSYVKISSVSKWTEMSFHLSLVTSENHWVRPKGFLSLWYVRSQPDTYLKPIITVSKRTKTRFHRRLLGVPSGASKTIYEPVVCSAQTMHLSCIKISTIG